MANIVTLGGLENTFVTGFINKRKTIAGDEKKRKLDVAYTNLSRSLKGDKWEYHLRVFLKQILDDIWYINDEIYVPTAKSIIHYFKKGLKNPFNVKDKTIYNLIDELTHSNTSKTLEQNISRLVYNVGRKISNRKPIKRIQKALIIKSESSEEDRGLLSFDKELYPNEDYKIYPAYKIKDKKLHPVEAEGYPYISKDDFRSAVKEYLLEKGYDKKEAEFVSQQSVNLLFGGESLSLPEGISEFGPPLFSKIYEENILQEAVEGVKSAAVSLIRKDDKGLKELLKIVGEHLGEIMYASRIFGGNLLISVLRGLEENDVKTDEIIGKLGMLITSNDGYIIDISDPYKANIENFVRQRAKKKKPSLLDVFKPSEEKTTSKEFDEVYKNAENFSSYVFKVLKRKIEDKFKDKKGTKNIKDVDINKIAERKAYEIEVLSFERILDAEKKLLGLKPKETEGIKRQLERVASVLSGVLGIVNEKTYNGIFTADYIDKYKLEEKLNELVTAYDKIDEKLQQESFSTVDKKEILKTINSIKNNIRYIVPKSLISSQIAKPSDRFVYNNITIRSPALPTLMTYNFMKGLSDIMDADIRGIVYKNIIEKIDDISTKVDEANISDATKKKFSNLLGAYKKILLTKKDIFENNKDTREPVVLSFLGKKELHGEMADIYIAFGLYDRLYTIGKGLIDLDESFSPKKILIDVITDLISNLSEEYNQRKEKIVSKALETLKIDNLSHSFYGIKQLPPITAIVPLRIYVSDIEIDGEKKPAPRFYYEINIPISFSLDDLEKAFQGTEERIKKYQIKADKLDKIPFIKMEVGRHIILNEVFPLLGITNYKEDDRMGIEVKQTLISSSMELNEEKVENVISRFISGSSYKLLRALEMMSDEPQKIRPLYDDLREALLRSFTQGEEDIIMFFRKFSEFLPQKLYKQRKVLEEVPKVSSEEEFPKVELPEKELYEIDPYEKGMANFAVRLSELSKGFETIAKRVGSGNFVLHLDTKNEQKLNKTPALNSIIWSIARHTPPFIAESVMLYAQVSGLVDVLDNHEKLIVETFKDFNYLENAIREKIQRENEFYKAKEITNLTIKNFYHNNFFIDSLTSTMYDLSTAVLVGGGDINKVQSFIDAISRNSIMEQMIEIDRKIEGGLSAVIDDTIHKQYAHIKAAEIALALGMFIKQPLISVGVIGTEKKGNKLSKNYYIVRIPNPSEKIPITLVDILYGKQNNKYTTALNKIAYNPDVRKELDLIIKYIEEEGYQKYVDSSTKNLENLLSEIKVKLDKSHPAVKRAIKYIIIAAATKIIIEENENAPKDAIEILARSKIIDERKRPRVFVSANERIDKLSKLVGGQDKLLAHLENTAVLLALNPDLEYFLFSSPQEKINIFTAKISNTASGDVVYDNKKIKSANITVSFGLNDFIRKLSSEVIGEGNIDKILPYIKEKTGLKVKNQKVIKMVNLKLEIKKVKEFFDKINEKIVQSVQ